MNKFYTDCIGGFLYIDKCKGDDNFINLKIEEEQEDFSYTSINISLHKEEIKYLIKDLQALIK